jgi:hypothetical protein
VFGNYAAQSVATWTPQLPRLGAWCACLPKHQADKLVDACNYWIELRPAVVRPLPIRWLTNDLGSSAPTRRLSDQRSNGYKELMSHSQRRATCTQLAGGAVKVVRKFFDWNLRRLRATSLRSAAAALSLTVVRPWHRKTGTAKVRWKTASPTTRRSLGRRKDGKSEVEKPALGHDRVDGKIFTPTTPIRSSSRCKKGIGCVTRRQERETLSVRRWLLATKLLDGPA